MMKIALIIFTKNEFKNSQETFPKVPKEAVDAIYVVDANSTDGTRDYYQKKKIKIFDQNLPAWGGAYESAFRNTKEDALIFWHPDGNMNPNDIKTFVKFLRKGSQFVIATRMIKGAYNEEDNQFFKPRKWYNIGVAKIVNSVWGKKLPVTTDMTQGFRAITRKAYRKMNIAVPSPASPDLEQIIKARKKNIGIDEFPTKEGERIHGDTYLSSFRAGRESINVLLAELFFR